MVGQGDELLGRVGRYTLAKIVFDAFMNDELPEKVTFELTSIKNTENHANFDILKTDTQATLQPKVSHKQFKRIYGVVFFIIFMLALYFMIF